MKNASTTAVRAPLSKLKNNLLKLIVPTHLRRGFFIMSLASYVLQQARADKILARQLVQNLDLPVEPKVLLIAMDHNQRVWSHLECGLDCHDNYTAENLRRFVKQVIESTPEWLRYSSERSMRRDALRTAQLTRRYSQASLSN